MLFHEFLRTRLQVDGFSTEDTLSAFLPLVREVLEAHAAGCVAPLAGLEALRVAEGQVWFEQSKRQAVRDAGSVLRRMEAANQAQFAIVAEVRHTTDVDGDGEEFVNLAIGRRDAEIERPVYLPGYVTWEHQIGHHDPLTDIFSLGLLLASLACGMDFTEPEDLGRFVACRRNLFQLAPDLHPVLARAILRMTELDRHQRVQDLRALLHNLEQYREQEVDFECDVARVTGFVDKDKSGKQQILLSKLRERLFEISRRNRLLHFRPTMQSVNLTQASIPLSFDIKTIRADQILVWNDDVQAALGKGPVSLNKYLNFSEALYLPSLLDHILAESKRDQAEFGFAQLRLAICFLRWSNLKVKPAESFDSPFVLLPVVMKKQKGIRDVYVLETVSQEAEVNPVVRHLFQQLYDIDLPEYVDLSATTLDALYEYLVKRVEASEPAVTLHKIDRPRVALIHERAKRRLDQYRRRARLAGRGVHSFLDLDYSYDPANYYPLGIRLFSTRIRPPRTHLQEIVAERPRPRTFAVPESEPPVTEIERSFFSLHERSDQDSPYAWEFDQCSVTLGNFKYRKMSLVRDYESLLEKQPPNRPFDATFSLVPRALERALPAVPPLEDRFDVLPCDPTQAAAIAEARDGDCYIIQGPPGTGKSQTITNLIADYVARGKRVLFVCEKRAAIDVVYARLRQRGLGELCSLIHDSQTDKRLFVMDLKQTYERIWDDPRQANKKRPQRTDCLRRLNNELRPLADFDAAMQQSPAEIGIPIRQLLDRCIDLRDHLPALTSLEQERLPAHALWWDHRDVIESLTDRLRDLRSDGILANHPLRWLSTQLLQVDRPLETVLAATQAAEQQFVEIDQTLGCGGVPRDKWSTLQRARQLVDHAKQVLPLARLDQLALVDVKSARAKDFTTTLTNLQRQTAKVAQAQTATAAWRHKLPAAEVAAALAQARVWEDSWFSWLQPAWWRLRGILKRAYAFSSHVVRPTWSQILGALAQEYAEADELRRLRAAACQKFSLPGDIDELAQFVLQLRETIPRLPGWLGEIHATWMRSSETRGHLERIVAADEALAALDGSLARIVVCDPERTMDALRVDLQKISAALDDLPEFLPCLSDLARMPPSLSNALRNFALTPQQLAAAVAHRSAGEVMRRERALSGFRGETREQHVARLETLYPAWLETNADELRKRVQDRFRQAAQEAASATAPVREEQRESKKRYLRGRKELEHEFGKTMRFKSIRDLVAGDSGIVLKDLKPVWLMSPLSVSDTLPLDASYFDVVIFDEASQIPLEEAVPALFRAGQMIVVGDEMQLPPTDFFSAKRAMLEEEEISVEEDREVFEYDLEGKSFLSHAAKNLAATMLGWHYRSRSESLISFSNWAFYDGRLLTVPEERLVAPDRPPIRISHSSAASSAVEELLARSISYHRLEHGVYDKRRNRAEAEYIAELVRELLRRQANRSIGIVAFSEAQQDEIDGALERLAQQDRAFGDLLENEREREVDGQFVGLLVKNLENIQGDERDIVVLSICYGYAPHGKMLMNFGPINKSGGAKRLNVAFSRAKHHMAVVSSIEDRDITNDFNDGANCLKHYLRYAAAVSTGNTAAAQRVLRAMSRWQESHERDDDRPRDAVVEQLAQRLLEHGFLVDRSVGQSHFRCDLAVRRAGDAEYRLAILVDTDAYYEQSDLLERDLQRPRLLRDFGWQVAFVLARDWYADHQATFARLLALLER